MQFLKKHYEKIILCIVLLALAVAAVMLSIKVSNVKRSLVKAGKTIDSYPRVPLKAVDLTAFQNSLAVHTNAPALSMTNRHLLFNPVRWYKKPDGNIIKVSTGSEIGIGALQASSIRPLKRIVSLESASGTGEKARYNIGIVKQAGATPADRRKITQFASLNEKNKYFMLKEVRGDVPIEATLVLVWLEDETNDELLVSKAMPSEKTTDYVVDMAYPPDNQEFKGKRVNESITIAGENYIIIAITETQVVMSAERNQKRTIVPLRATP
ncbi:MAG TPA: hypothetical protein VGH19_18725 [Verrucomicrobiae bacterium]